MERKRHGGRYTEKEKSNNFRGSNNNNTDYIASGSIHSKQFRYVLSKGR